MSKFDKLIKKVESFEKLAIFSDRKEFLKAIAGELDPGVKAVLNKIDAYLRNMSDVDTSKASNAVGNALLFKNLDVNAITSGLRDVLTKLPASLSGTGFKDINNLIVELRNAQSAAQPKEDVMQMPEDRITAYPPIDKAQQEALSRITVIEGLGLPLKIDGKLGPETRAALKAYKKKFNLESLSDQDALAGAQMMADNLKEYRGV